MSADEDAILYGLEYVGRFRSDGRTVYRFTDLLTSNILEVNRLSQLPTAVLSNRADGFVDLLENKSHEQAVVLSEKFHGHTARFEREIEIEWPKSLTSLGVCARVDYIADKWDDGIVRYWHEFIGPVMLFADPDVQKNGNQVLVIYGKIKIESEGITG